MLQQRSAAQSAPTCLSPRQHEERSRLRRSSGQNPPPSACWTAAAAYVPDPASSRSTAGKRVCVCACAGGSCEQARANACARCADKSAQRASAMRRLERREQRRGDSSSAGLGGRTWPFEAGEQRGGARGSALGTKGALSRPQLDHRHLVAISSPLGHCNPAQELLPPRAADDEAQVHALRGKALLQALAREVAQELHRRAGSTVHFRSCAEFS